MECIIYFSICKRKQIEYNIKVFLCYILPFNYYEIIPQKEKTGCYKSSFITFIPYKDKNNFFVHQIDSLAKW